MIAALTISTGVLVVASAWVAAAGATVALMLKLNGTRRSHMAEEIPAAMLALITWPYVLVWVAPCTIRKNHARSGWNAMTMDQRMVVVESYGVGWDEFSKLPRRQRRGLARASESALIFAAHDTAGGSPTPTSTQS